MNAAGYGQYAATYRYILNSKLLNQDVGKKHIFLIFRKFTKTSAVGTPVTASSTGWWKSQASDQRLAMPCVASHFDQAGMN